MNNASNAIRAEKGTLAIFLVCMVITALAMVIGLWAGIEHEQYFMTAFTFFVVGLASFLIWLPLLLYRLLAALSQQNQ